jgi:hypothetical protein
MLKSLGFVFMFIAICQFSLVAQDKSIVHGLQRSPEDQALLDKMDLTYKKKDWPAYELASKEYIAFAPMSSSGYYNLACAQMLQNKIDDGFVSLEKSVELGWIDLDHLQNDNDFKGQGIKEDKRWKTIIDKLKFNLSKLNLKNEIYTLYNASKYEQALVSCARYIKNYKTDSGIAYWQAKCYGKLDKKDLALKYLDQSADLHDRPYNVILKYEPSFKAFANDAKFKAIQTKLTKKALDIEKAEKAKEALLKK